MTGILLPWLRRFVPPQNTASLAERLRASGGALCGLALTALLGTLFYRVAGVPPLFIAPLGASAVLVFCLPASPLAQPWSVVGGNAVSAFVGVACAHWIANPLVAVPLACSLAIAAMFALRCLHPPGGAAALTAVLGGPAVHSLGFGFALMPTALESSLIVLGGLLYNNLTRRRYPHQQQSSLQSTHATADPVPTARLGFAPEDLDAVLKRYGQVLDVSRDDLEQIILQTEMQSYGRRFGVILCSDIMSRDVRTLEFATPLAEAWVLMRRHQVHALPVLNAARRVIGIVTQSDFLQHGELDNYDTLRERLQRFLQATPTVHSDKPEVVGQIMSSKVHTADAATPIAQLMPLMANTNLHHIPIVDAEQRFVGIVTQSDLVAALYATRQH